MFVSAIVSLLVIFLVLKVIKLLLFGPSRSSNCIDGLLIEKDNIIFDHT